MLNAGEGGRIRNFSLVVGLMVVAGVLALPQDGLEFIYGYVPWLGNLIDRGNKLFEPVSLVHSLLFVIITLYVWLSCRSFSCVAILLGLGAFASATEVMQLSVPGRQMRVSDLLGNYLGIVIGVMVIGLVRVGRKENR